MKKNARVLALLMALVMTFAMGFSACGKKAEPNDGQNPVMNFIGYYVCDRADVYISADGDEGATALVTWGSSAWENSSWVMSGTFDPETLQFEYHDCVRTDYVYDDNGEETSRTEVYTGGHGFMFFSEGDPLTLTWQDDQENIADGMVFKYESAVPEGAEVGLANPWSDVDSAEAAAEGAGLDGFAAAEGTEISLGEVEVTQYRCMDGMAEAIVEFPAVEMTIRKAEVSLEMAEGDISGDYGEYANDWFMTIGDVELRCFGNREGESTKTIWHIGDKDYSIVVQGLGGDTDYGLSEDDITALFNAIN